MSVKHEVITQSGAAQERAVLAPLTRSLHVIRLPDGPVGLEHPCSSPTFRPLPCVLSWLTHSVQRCEMPAPERHQPAGQLPCTLQRAPCLRPLRLLCCRGLFAALRRRRCARSRSQGGDRQFGEARMAVHERSVRHDVAAEGTAQRREDGPAAEEARWPAPAGPHAYKKRPPL